ncbi:apolipoprotein B-100 isoform X1 [Chanos chanos]|uniref:Apolipoprotein B-100 isoform X1 n=1 Tax=Chanos chanos TaxID=29144 RepID=A0A6J2VA27_CHACN|nr:apolipoprotein B-100-like isoform X1 [Chanos chanos]
MGDTKLCLLLLLSTIALTKAQEEDAPCLIAKRYKSFHKYEYLYEAESLNALNGAINGPKGSCKVVIEVPGPCSYIVHTTECTLSEVTDVDADGNPVFAPAAGAEAFKAAMEKHPLKVTVKGDNDIKLFPEDDEPINILNIKRGIISALAVPVLEEERNKRMPTIYGLCKTDYAVNAREDIATDVTLTRDLSRCDNFRPVKDHTSPLALITGMHYPLAQLIRSTQTCNYKFDNAQSHMTSGSCTENHILVPFSHKGEYGVTNVGKQALTLVEVTEYDERVFDHNEANMKTLHPDASIDQSPIQDKDAALAVLRELAGLSKTSDGHKRAYLAHKLVSMIRKLNAETLAAGVHEALEISRPLTYQALFQCGTPECSTAIMQILRTFDSSSVEIDAAVFAMGLVPNPSRVLVKEMLEMAKFKPSKPIYYAASNAVRRLYQAEGKVTPEIQAVADYALEQIGDCTGDQDHLFLSLRVIGNMAAAMGAASPALKSAVIQCVNQPAASPEVQQAAIQAFRLTSVPEEGREVLMQVLLDGAAPLQKRVAAYLILMKDPQPAELAQLAAALPAEENIQAKSFVISHVTNILSSTAPETTELRQKILDALQGNEIGSVMDPTKFSRNYKMASLQGNMIFESTSHLPKEVMLEMTLKAFGYDMDMVEIGMEGKGFEPTVEALFGANGFFPDTVLKTIYYAADKMPVQINQVLRNILPALRNDRKKRQASQNIIKEISRNVNKLIAELKAHDAPEATVYLRLLGAELGFLKTKEMEEMAYSAAMMIDNLLKMFPTDLIKGLLSSADNELFLHYIFMDNEFYLPTGPGVPLRVALSGTFTPGVKGGLSIAPDMSEVAFMPSAGIEFVTEVGAHFPDYVHSGLEMHTNIFHESGLRAKVAMTDSNVKLSIPAPQGPTKLISITNSLVSVTGAEIKPIPSVMERVDVSECTPLFPGLKYCTALQYSDAMSNDAAPYFPFTGDSKLAIEVHPTGEVSEYSATIDYAYEDKVDKLTVDVKAEGTSVEAKAALMFNRQKYTVSADLQIPDYDLEAGLRFGAVDPSTKGKGTHSIQIDLINKNIPQASLVAHAKIEAVKDAKLEVQLLVPSVQADATVSANLKHAEELTLELKSDIKLPETSSVQSVTLKYDAEKIEAEVKSDVNSEIHNIIPNIDAVKTMANGLLDHQIGQTEMKVRDILSKSVEASNAYLEKFAGEIPYLQNLRVPALPEITLPERLFLNAEAAAKYHFGQHHYTIILPLPLGGKSSEELNFPAALTTPHLAVPQLGIELASVQIPLPEVFVPESITVSLPVFGMAELSGKVSSNLYDLEAAVSAGRDPVENPSYSAKVEVTGTSPVDLLSLKVEGSALLAGTPDDSLKAELKTSVSHKLIDASASVVEEVRIAEKVSVKTSSKIEATSPLGLQVSLEHTGQLGVNAEEISGDCNLEGSLKAGPVYGTATLTPSFAVFPFRPEAKIDTSLKVDSTLLQAQNTIAAAFANGELSIASNTAVFEDSLTHVAEVTFKESTLAVKSDTKALALGLTVQNVAEATAGAGVVSIKVDSAVEQSEDRIHSLVTATLDVNGLAVNSDASGKLGSHSAAHKASLTLNKDGLITSGTTSLQSPLTLENTFSGALDASKASLSIETKSGYAGITAENTNSLTASLSSVAFASKADAVVADGTSYSHDIAFNVEPYTALVKISNDLKILHVNLVNEAELKAEPYKADLTGNVKLAYAEEELKHTYEISYADLAATAKCSTTGKLLGAHMSHNSEVDIAGLSLRVNNDARFNSQPLRFDTTIRATAVPFAFNVDAIANADGDLNLYGKQSAQLYTKVLLKAEPLAFAHSHECRVSTTQNLDNGVSIETNLDNKVDTILSPSEQKAALRLKAKVNNHAINQELSVFNTPERLGLEVSGAVITNLLNTVDQENQDFSVSGFLKYDKSTDSHVINIPFIESLPAILENVKIIVVNMAEALQSYINKHDIAAKIENLPQLISDFVTELNLEGRVIQLRTELIALTQEYAITLDDLEASLLNIKAALEKLLSDLTIRIHDVVDLVKELIVSGTLSDTVVQRLTEELNAFNEEYDISAIVLAVIEAIEDVIKKIDLAKLQDSSIAFLHDLDAKYAVKENLEETMSKLKQMIESFDKAKLVEDLKNLISSVDIQSYVETVKAQIPTEELTKIVDTAKALITEMNIIERLNGIYGNVRSVLVKYEVDKRIEALLDKIVELIKHFKFDETVQVVANTLKTIPVPVTKLLDDAITYLKETEVKQAIEHLNEHIDAFISQVKSFDYNAFVDEANQKISEYITELNTLISSLEVPQKVEATREFLNYIVSSLNAFLEELREVKVADVIKTLKDIIDSVVLNDVKTLVDNLKQRIPEMDLKGEIHQVLQQVSDVYTKILTIVTDSFVVVIEMANKLLAEQPIFSEVKQLVEGIVNGLKTAELELPSLTVPFTNLVLPSMKISLDKLQEIELPSQVDIPEFTILGFHTVPATTITYDDLKQRITEIIDFILNLEFNMLDVDAFFGELKMNYLPDLSAVTLPEITIPEISLPAIPKFNLEHGLDIPLQIPEIKLPAIPSELLMPCFGKLYGEIRASTPIYNIRTSAEFQNSTDSEETPQFTIFITSQGKSESLEILNYNLDSTARVAVPKMSRVIIADTLKFTHSAVAVEHQASVTIYGQSAQASGKTTIKVTTAPYTGTIVNSAFLAIEDGMSFAVDTTYNHQVDVPLLTLTSEASLTQKLVVRQESTTITLTVGNEGTGKIGLFDFSDEGTHKSDLHFTIDPSTAKLTLSGDTDASSLKIKQKVSADGVVFSHITFDARVEAESSFIKNSLIVASGNAHLGDMKVEAKVNHDTELVGAFSGTLSNALNILIQPIEVVLDFQNKGNTILSLPESLSAKIDLQNDYSVTLNLDMQQVNTVALLRLNQYKYSHNLTIDHNKAEAGVYAAVNGEANLDFLTVPISIPEIAVPVIDFKTPAINDINLYEHTGLKDLLTTTEQTFDVDAKIVYQKSRFAPIFDLGLISVPALGNLISEMTFKSAIFNLNANAAIHGDDDLVIRIGAISASVFEGLKAKLDGTSSLTTKRGVKLATALSLENVHIQGTHDSTVSLNTDDLEASASLTTVAKVNLPILTLEASHHLLGDTKTHPTATSTLKAKYTMDIPIIQAVGSGDAENSLKIEAGLFFISAETATKGSIDGTFLESGVIKGALDNEASLFLGRDGLRSTLKTVGNANVNRGDLKVELDVDENLALEAALSRVYAVLKLACNNEINVAALNTKGKHSAQATIDLAPLNSLTADVEIDLSQPSTLGDLSIFEKAVAEVTAAKQTVASTSKIISPVYTTNVEAKVEGEAPIYTVIFKASATSPIVLLDYDLDSSISSAMDNDALSLTAKAVLTHAEATLDIQHVLSLALSHTLNMDITSPSFTDVNFRYAARTDGISVSVSTPSTGFLGLQLQGSIPSQLHARLYSRYASAPEDDVDILSIRAAAKEDKKMHLQAAYNLEAPHEMIMGLKERLPAITSSITGFADKYGILGAVRGLWATIVNGITEAYTAASAHAPELSQLSILFRNVIVQYQKTVQIFIDAAVKILRETHIQLPGMEEKTSLPEICQKVTSNVATVLEQLVQVITDNLEVYLTPIIETISPVQVVLPSGEVMTGTQILDHVKSTLKTLSTQAVELVRELESLDVILQKLGETLHAVVEKAQEFIDNIKSDILDTAAVYLNAYYANLVTVVKSLLEMVDAELTIEKLNEIIGHCLDYVMSILSTVISTVAGVLPTDGLVKVNDGKLEIELPFPFHQ